MIIIILPHVAAGTHWMPSAELGLFVNDVCAKNSSTFCVVGWLGGGDGMGWPLSLPSWCGCTKLMLCGKLDRLANDDIAGSDDGHMNRKKG